jgi:single-stranded-DNA-specific exonuclease
VSLKVAQALLADHPKYEAVLTSLLKLAAIGTVADLVPLTSRENRAIVSMGLGALNEGRHHPGLAELLKVSQLTPGSIRESDLGFRVGPRINAAGRVSSAELVVELLNCRDPFRARDLAKHIDGLNTERRDIERRLTDVALGAVSDPPDPFVLVAGPEEDGWHRGVVGIVAARIKERVNRPTAVVSIQGDRAVGSVRSVAGVHAVRALESVEDLLVKFGGHPAAAGFTVPVEHLDAMRSRLGAWVAENHSDDDLIPKRGVDVVVAARDLDDTLFFDFARLAPFGMGNPVPRLLVQNVRPWNARVIGKARTTLKFLIPRGDGSHVEAIWWGRPEMLDALSSHAVDLLGNLEENVWKGRRSLQFRVKDVRITS